MAALTAAIPFTVSAQQLTRADFERSMEIGQKYSKLTVNVAGQPEWQGDSDTVLYSKSVEGGHEFMVVDADKLTKEPAFDHAKLAAALSKASKKEYKPFDLPFRNFRFVDHRSAIEFAAEGGGWRCDLSSYTCKSQPVNFRGRGNRNDGGETINGAPVIDGVIEGGYDDTPKAENSREHTVASPDGQWLAFIDNYNVWVRSKDGKQESALSDDGSEGDYYALRTLNWSPDSKHLVAYRILPGYRRLVQYVESSPANQLQPKSYVMVYPKAGDVLTLEQPSLFQIADKQEIRIDSALFSNPWNISRAEWWKDSRGFTFEYNQRGHQVFRVIEVDAATGKTRALITEQSKTFIDYEPLRDNQYDNGSIYRHDVNDGQEIIWASERDGWKHLYLYNGKTQQVENQITKGDWVVRAVNYVDDQKRQIYFEASGMNPGEDPYFVHAYRINFDGT
ncbi:MAG: DPP IV N-terminal domain-containing protein, partial [Acidobacteriaceae bacterium]